MGTGAFRNNPGQLAPSEAQGTRFVAKSGMQQSAITVTVPFSVTVASVGTPATIWNPTAGTRFRVLGYTVTPGATDTIVMRAVASVAFQITLRGLANVAVNSPSGMGDFGIACASINTALVVDAATAATTVTGTIFGTLDSGTTY